jgi:hypothetical protein
MKVQLVIVAAACLLAAAAARAEGPAPAAPAQNNADERIAALEHRVADLEQSLAHKSSVAFVLFLYGVFCALWAQNTGRSAWLWFFLGLLFSVITVIVLLAKNSDDRKRRRRGHADQQPIETRAGAG